LTLNVSLARFAGALADEIGERMITLAAIALSLTVRALSAHAFADALKKKRKKGCFGFYFRLLKRIAAATTIAMMTIAAIAM
jgi:hypothetical protein